MSRAIMKRRALLRALGGAAFLGVPVFRSALLEAQRGSVPVRFLAIHFPGGVTLTGSSIAQSSFTFSEVLSPLVPLQQDMVVLHDLNNPSAEKIVLDGRGEGHGAGMRTILTGDSRGPDHEESRDIQPGQDPSIYFGPITSLDQLLAKQIGSGFRLPSLQLGIITDKVSEQSLGHRRLSFDNGSPLRPIQEPKAAFDRLFAAGIPSSAPQGQEPEPISMELQRAHARQQSILDLLLREVAEVQSLASSAERQKLEQHLTSLREIEQGLRSASGSGALGNPNAGCMAPAVGDPADFRGIGQAMNALTFQALNCDLTRIITLQWMHSGDQWEHFPWLNVARDHHGMEHGWGESRSVGTDLNKVQTWLMSQVAELLTVMKQTQEGDATMLDNSIVYVASEMTDGGGHSHSPVTGFVAGKAGGKITSGRILDARGRSNNDLLTAFAQLMGVNLPAVGDAAFNSGPLSLG